MRLEEVQRQVEIVRDGDDQHLLRESREKAVHRELMLQIKKGRRLVEQQRFRLLRQRGGEKHALAFASGERAKISPGEDRVSVYLMAAATASLSAADSNQPSA